MSGLPLNIEIQQIFLHMLNFVILAGGLYFLLYKPVCAFINKRTEYFANLENEALNKKTEADSMLTEYQNKIKAVEEELKAIKAKASHDADEIIRQSREEAEEQGHRIIMDAQAEAQKTKDKIIKGGERDIIKLVLAAEKKLHHYSEDEK